MALLRVEDCAMISETVLQVLRGEQYAVDGVRDGSMADEAHRCAVCNMGDLTLDCHDPGLP